MILRTILNISNPNPPVKGSSLYFSLYFLLIFLLIQGGFSLAILAYTGQLSSCEPGR